ncbi:MAG TPA: efflux RND transporter periplasmic adaptor subunit, partial [Planctomycetota bacterium]|nr:efflux RND transporter periplasmic adaptor subunit [Planctomycetota bacterium]
LTELKSFARVLAPFAGTITQRWVEVGQLVTVGTGQSQAQALFRVAEADVVRLFVNVPQSSAPSVRAGLPAELLLREFPGRKFAGEITRTSRAIDPQTRTLLTEVRVPNADRALLPGMFARARLHVARERPALLVPAGALVVTGEGTQLALVGEGDRVHFQKVEVDVDYGTELAVGAGLEGDERVIANPGERLTEGLVVQVATPAAAAKPEAASAPKAATATEAAAEAKKRGG